MKAKKILALLLAAMMALAMLAGCTSNNDPQDGSQQPEEQQSTPVETPDNSGESQAPTGEIPTITWYTVGGGMPSNIDAWTEKANAYLEQKIGVHINVQCVSWDGWNQRRAVIVQSNEPYDIIFTDMSAFGSDVAMGAFADLTDLIKDTPGLTDLIPANYLDAVKVDGKLYGIPAYKDSSATQYFVWTKEHVDSYFEGWADVHSVADCTEGLRALKEGTGVAPVLLDKNGISCMVGNRYDNLCTGLPALGISYFDGSNKIVCTFEQEDVMEQFKIVHQWFSEGLINSDAAVLGDANNTMCTMGVAQGWPAAAGGWGLSRGADVVVSQFGETVMSNDTIQGSIACISASSQHKAEALKLLELVNTDTTMRDMMAYGEEGVNFKYLEKDGEKRVWKINNDWTLPAYTQGSYMTMTPTVDGKTEEEAMSADFGVNPYITEVDAQNKSATVSPALGFNFDTTNVADELAACKAIFEEYKGQLYTGTGDPEVLVPEIMAAMRDSGFDAIVAEAQAQYDAWRG